MSSPNTINIDISSLGTYVNHFGATFGCMMDFKDNDIRWLGGLVGSRKSEKIGYRRVGRSEEIGYPIFLGNFTLESQNFT